MGKNYFNFLIQKYDTCQTRELDKKDLENNEHEGKNSNKSENYYGDDNAKQVPKKSEEDGVNTLSNKNCYIYLHVS